MTEKTEAPVTSKDPAKSGPVKFTYVGPEGETEAFGLMFEKNTPVEVSDPHAIAKLKHNQNFTWSGRPADAPPPPKLAKGGTHKPLRPSDGPKED